MEEKARTRHPFDLEDRTLSFAKDVIGLCKQLPQNAINREIIGQLVRSSGSVGANYREANDALSKKISPIASRLSVKRRRKRAIGLNFYWKQLLNIDLTLIGCLTNPLS